MKVIILAAGRGSRLGNYTKELPKALVDINAVKRWKRVLGHHHNYEYDVHVNTKNPYGNK